MLTLLIGAARSGKSRLALRLAERSGRPVVVIATAEARDEEMTERIRRHRSERPADWETIEEPLALESVLELAAPEAAVLVDCLTLWVSNLMESGFTDEAIEARAGQAAKVAAAHAGIVVVVTNEVGAGIVPTEPVARRFRDLLGSVNSIWAEASDRSVQVVAGKIVPLQDTSSLFDA